MEHIAIDLGSRESQICVRSSDGVVQEEVRLPTRPSDLSRYLRRRAPGRVVVETGAEAFWVAELAQAAGHEVRVVPSALAPALGVGRHGMKTDRRDAAVLSEASCRVELPSVHIPRKAARRLQSRLGLREALTRARTLTANAVHGYLRTTGDRVRSGAVETLPKRVREALKEQSAPLEAVLAAIERGTESITEFDVELNATAKASEVAVRLQTVPGVGPITALRFLATIDEIGRFRNGAAVRSYVGLVPSEHSSGQKQRRGAITKAGSPAMRAVLVQAAHAAMRSKRKTDPMVRWANRVAGRRGRNVAVVALARKMAGMLYAIWRDGSKYEPWRAAEAEQPQVPVAPLLPPRP